MYIIAPNSQNVNPYFDLWQKSHTPGTTGKIAKKKGPFRVLPQTLPRERIGALFETLGRLYYKVIPNALAL